MFTGRQARLIAHAVVQASTLLAAVQLLKSSAHIQLKGKILALVSCWLSAI